MKKWLASVMTALIATSFVTTVPPAKAAVATGVGVVSNGLVLYYDPANPLAYNNGKLRDLSGNGYDASFNKQGLWPGEETTQGKYLGFDGAGGYLDVDSNLSGVSWPGVTITFYANFGGGAGNFERILDFGNGFEANNIVVGRWGSNNILFAEVFQNNASNGHCKSANDSIVSGQWAYWAVTFDGTNCKIYKNDIFNASMAYTKLPYSTIRNNAYIGKSNWADAAFEGGISDLAVYNRVLSSSELTQNYNAGVDYTAPSLSGGGNATNENQDYATSIGFDNFGTTFSIIGGNDAGKVSINSSGYVSFIPNASYPYYPNYESPSDYGLDRRYDFTIRAIDPSGNYTDYATYVTISNVSENATLTTPTLSATPTKGIAVTITVTPGGDSPIPTGKVTYLMAGKRIAGCYKKTYSGSGNSTCSWKPTAQGYREITVTFTPTSNTYSAATSRNTFLVYKRSNLR